MVDRHCPASPTDRSPIHKSTVEETIVNENSQEFASAIEKGILTSFATVAVLASGIAMGQQADDNDEADEAAQLEGVQVTGSRIRRTDIEGPTPTLVLDRNDFENQSFLTVTDVLDSLTQNTGGSLTQQFVFGFTPGASGVNLRGFGTGRTLVLIDGRRIPVYPLGIGGTSNFFDLSSIPTAIIERIEVLTDGASAIYGSDAVGGVINIITRKDFDGLTTRARYGDTSDGGYQTDQYEVVGGVTNGTTSAYLTFQHLSNEQLLASQRDYAASDIADPLGRGTFSTFGSNLVEIDPATGGIIVTPAPGCGTPGGPLGGDGIAPGTPGSGVLFGVSPCGFDRSAFRQLFPENDRNTLSGRIDHELDSGVNLFAFGRWTKSQTDTQIEPFPYAGTALFGGAAANPIVPNNGGLTTGPNGGPAVFVRRLVEFGPRTSDIETESYGATLGADGRFGSWEWEAAYTFNVQEVFSQRSGSIITSALESRIDNGLDLFQPIPQSVVDAVSFTPITDAESRNDLFDFQFNGFLPWDLPGGPVGVAGIAEFEQQEFFDRRDPITRDAAGTLNGGALFAVARNLSLQEIQGVDISASYAINAGRFGRFDFQSETTWVDKLTTRFDDESPKTTGVGIFSIPEWRSNFTTNWNRGDLGATVRATYIGEMGGLNSNAPLTGAQTIDSQLTFNGQLRYSLGRSPELSFGVNNITDQKPPTDPTNPQWPWFINAGGFYSPFGREFYVEWVQHWN